MAMRMRKALRVLEKVGHVEPEKENDSNVVNLSLRCLRYAGKLRIGRIERSEWMRGRLGKGMNDDDGGGVSSQTT